MSDYAERTKRGLEILKKLGFPRMVVTEKCPDLYDMTVGHLFGDVWSRPHLSLRDRELITMASLVTLARAGALAHFRSAENSGISKEQIMELIIQVGHYAGWPVMAPAIIQYNQAMEENAKARKQARKKRSSGKKRTA